MHAMRPKLEGNLAVMLVALLGIPACSLVTVQQEPFSTLEVSAKRPAPPPARVVLTDSSIQITEKIQFALNDAAILPASNGLLAEIITALKDNPQIEIVQIEGHTDSTGSPAKNRTLSLKRAESVVAALVAGGVEKKRLVPKGFGPDKPIADNTTDAGKESNRRVEFNIVKQGPKKTLVQD
jgi:OmpA-OmpF porin, OOP family